MRQISDLSHIALISNQQMVIAFSIHISKKVEKKTENRKPNNQFDALNVCYNIEFSAQAISGF